MSTNFMSNVKLHLYTSEIHITHLSDAYIQGIKLHHATQMLDDDDKSDKHLPLHTLCSSSCGGQMFPQLLSRQSEQVCQFTVGKSEYSSSFKVAPVLHNFSLFFCGLSIKKIKICPLKVPQLNGNEH